MYGQAFKCDGCGRVTFVNGTNGAPPEGWFALSHVPETSTPDLVVWPSWHFDRIDCVATFVDALRDRASEPEPDVVHPLAEPGEVLSQWDAAVTPVLG